MEIKDITRKQIEDEENYKILQKFGRTFRKEGHKLVLNSPEDELKKRLLVIFDEHYSTEVESEPEIIDYGKSKEISAPVSEKPAVIPGRPKKSEPIDDIPKMGHEIEPVPAVESKESGVTLYIAPRAYKDWASGWQFTPGMDKPKPLPKKLTPGLENAIKNKKIIPYEK